jgi:hypothetical protein
MICGAYHISYGDPDICSGCFPSLHSTLLILAPNAVNLSSLSKRTFPSSGDRSKEGPGDVSQRRDFPSDKVSQEYYYDNKWNPKDGKD